MNSLDYESDKIVSTFLRRVKIYEDRFELITKRCEELKQLGINFTLKPVPVASILELERKLRKKLPDEYAAFLYYIGSGKISYKFYSPAEVWEEYIHFKNIERHHSNRYVQIENFKQLKREQFEETSGKNQTWLAIQKIKDGAMPIMEMGCIGSVMMTLRGEMAGTVWEVACEGRYTISLEKPPFAEEDEEFQPLTFIPWMEDKLKRELKFKQLING